MEQSGNRIDYYDTGIEVADQVMDFDQVHFKAKRGRPRSVQIQQPLVHPAPQIESDGPHISHDLIRGFFEREEDAFLAASAPSIYEVRRQAGLPGACRS